MATGWSSTAGGRRELVIIIGFVLANLIAPLCFEELFPFSRVALFPDVSDQDCDYALRGPDHRALSPAAFGLQRNYWGLRGFSLAHPRPHVGAIALPETIDRFGACAGEAEVRSFVRARLQHLRLPWVEVTQQVIAATGERVGVVAQQTWRIAAPASTP